jgi:hypothetical protein
MAMADRHENTPSEHKPHSKRSRKLARDPNRRPEPDDETVRKPSRRSDPDDMEWSWGEEGGDDPEDEDLRALAELGQGFDDEDTDDDDGGDTVWGMDDD